MGGNILQQLAASQELKRRSQQPREAIATQQRLILSLDVRRKQKPRLPGCPQKCLETESLMMQGSFTHPTTFIEHLSHAKDLVSVGDKMPSKRKLFSALENSIAIKEDEDMKGILWI